MSYSGGCDNRGFFFSSSFENLPTSTHAAAQVDKGLTDLPSQHLIKQHAEGPPVHRFPIRLVGNNLKDKDFGQERHCGPQRKLYSFISTLVMLFESCKRCDFNILGVNKVESNLIKSALVWLHYQINPTSVQIEQFKRDSCLLNTNG